MMAALGKGRHKEGIQYATRVELRRLYDEYKAKKDYVVCTAR